MKKWFLSACVQNANSIIIFPELLGRFEMDALLHQGFLSNRLIGKEETIQ